MTARPDKKLKGVKRPVSLARENEELRARLEEAEQTLDAIRSGKVDALIVSGPEGERVFTLQGADHRYRRIVEGMTEGAAIVSPAGLVLYANAAFSRLVGTPLDRVLGSALRGYIPPEALTTFDRLVEIASGAQGKAEQATILRSSDRIIPVHVSAAANAEEPSASSRRLEGDTRPDICFVVTDLSSTLREAERRRSELSADLEKAMRENEAQRKLFASLFTTAPAAISLLRGPDHVVEVANLGALELWGRSAQETLGRPLFQVLPEIVDQAFPTILAEAYRTGTPFVGTQIPVTLRNKDGLQTRFLNAVYTPTRDSRGAVDGITSFTIDVTLQVEARRRADESEEQFRQLVDNLPDLAWHAEPDGYIGFFNRRWYEYTGTTLEEMKGDGWTKVHRPDLAAEVVRRWGEATRTGDPFEMEFPLRGADGKFRWFLTRARPLRDSAGRIVRWIGTNTNIDERKRAIDAIDLLAQTSAVLSSSLDYEETLARIARLAVPRVGEMCTVYLRHDDGTVSQVAAAYMDDAGVDVLRVAEAARLFPEDAPYGYPQVLRTGKTELRTHVDVELFRAYLSADEHLPSLADVHIRSWIGVPLTRQSGGSGETIGALFFALTTAGRHFTAEDVPLAEEIGKRASLALENARLYRDAKVAVEAERSARDKAEEATRLKDEFLATLSHELRTPLNAILGWSRLLQTNALPPDRREHAVETVVRNAVAQNQLIDDLLDLGRIISGKMRLTVDAVDLTRVIAAAIDVVQPAADAKGVCLQREIDDEPVLVSGDGGRLQQVVWNLLANAVKFTPRGGHVVVMVQRNDASVEISVGDSGSGIAPAFLPYVFDRFRQQDGAITRKAGGLGLGLAIVKSIVELHGGTVEAHSDGEEKGSTFSVHIPLAPVRGTPPLAAREALAPVAAADGHLGDSAELAGLRILVVDDEADARDLLRTLFEHCQATVFTAASVPDALVVFDRERPELVVSDIGMPGENGYSLIRKLRARPTAEGGRTPAIALTAYARSEDRRRALVEGFQSHVAKPVDPHELLLTIVRVAQRHG